MKFEDASALVSQVKHWHHCIELLPGLVTPGSYDPAFLLEKLRLPARLDGSRVLDVGTSDGYFARELWRRGAAVSAVDYRGKTDHGYWVTEAVSGMEVAYHKQNIYDLSPAALGTFDTVLLLGVLYHLPDMLRAIHLMHSLTARHLFIETHCDNTAAPNIAYARYYKGRTLSGDPTNFWSPNRRCVLDMLEDAGFEIDRDEAWSDRLFVACTKAERRPGVFPKLSAAYGTT